MPRGKKSVKINEPVVNEAETNVEAEAEEAKTTVEVTANPETTEPENVTITRDENGEVVSVQPTQELIDQQNADVEKEEEEEEKSEEETEEKAEETETEKVENPVNENELFLNNDSSEATELQKDNSAETEKPEEEKAESTTEPLTPTAANRGIANQIITNPYGRRSVGYQPNPSRAVFTKADEQGNASVTIFGRRGEERIKRDWTSL